MSLGRPLPVLELTAEERRELVWFCRFPQPPSFSCRPRAQSGVVAAEGIATRRLPGASELVKPDGGSGGNASFGHRFKVIYDELRPGRPRIGLRRTGCRSAAPHPQAEAPWSNALKRSSGSRGNGLSKSTVHRVFQLSHCNRPQQEFKLSTDPFSSKGARCGRSLPEPPTTPVVLSVDEKSQIQALDRTAPLLPMHRPDRTPHPRYARHGTTSLFGRAGHQDGKVIGQNQQRHRFHRVPQLPRHHREERARALDVHLILDNYGRTRRS